MAEKAFPRAFEDIVATLADIFRQQGQADTVELLESAGARIEQTDYDNWNGGTYTYELKLDVPVPIFAAAARKLTAIEKSIASTLATICRNMGNDHLESVTITPLTSKATGVGPKAKPAEAEVGRIWKGGLFRLFLSHVSAHKVGVAKLRGELQLLGISAFVAHEDITPSLEWQNEIELALRSMHAMAVLLTPDFHRSDWTDQEVGFALAERVLAVPVCLGSDPYGFIAKVQGLRGCSLDQPARVANLLAATLLNHASTHRQMRTSLVSAFQSADSFASAIALSKVIATVKEFSEDERGRLLRACETNDQVRRAHRVVSRVHSALGVPVTAKVTDKAKLAFQMK